MDHDRQCRVCYETEEYTPFLTPCNCRGTQAYIHAHCLALYIRHFPDAMCRVCRTEMKLFQDDDTLYFVGSLVWMLTLMHASTLPHESRGMYLMFVSGIILYYLTVRQLPLRFVFVGMLLSASFLFLSVNTLFWILIAFSGMFTSMMLWMYVPTTYILVGLAILASTFYSAFLVIFALLKTDPTLASLLVCALGVIWYLMIRARPPFRNV